MPISNFEPSNNIIDRRGTPDRPEDSAWNPEAEERWRAHGEANAAAIRVTRDPLKVMALIRQVEARNRYDAFYAFKLPRFIPIDEMTVTQVLCYQDGFTRAGGASSAAGAYQIIQKTLGSLARQLGLSGAEIFDAEMQDRMARHLMLGRGLRRWLEGGDWQDFAHALSKEWASLPNVIGINRAGRADPSSSYWSGVAGNKALVSVDDMKEALA